MTNIFTMLFDRDRRNVCGTVVRTEHAGGKSLYTVIDNHSGVAYHGYSDRDLGLQEGDRMKLTLQKLITFRHHQPDRVDFAGAINGVGYGVPGTDIWEAIRNYRVV